MLESFKKLSKVTQFLSCLAVVSAVCIGVFPVAIQFSINPIYCNILKTLGMISFNVFFCSAGLAHYRYIRETIIPSDTLEKSNQSLYRFAGVFFTLGCVLQAISFVSPTHVIFLDLQIISIASLLISIPLVLWAVAMETNIFDKTISE